MWAWAGRVMRAYGVCACVVWEGRVSMSWMGWDWMGWDRGEGRATARLLLGSQLTAMQCVVTTGLLCRCMPNSRWNGIGPCHSS